MLFNKSIKEGKIPDKWKIAEVRPIFKKGLKQEPLLLEINEDKHRELLRLLRKLLLMEYSSLCPIIRDL